MIKKKSLNAAFTLIELLVVITIIGILAGIALPVFSQVQEKAQQTKSLASAKQIGLALKLYAGDNDGNFPTADGDPAGTPAADSVAADSNGAFRNLFPQYCTAEKLFYTPKSAYCNKSAPDEVYATKADCLKAGENNYSYIMNLTDTSNAGLPLIADGLAAGGTAYELDRTKPGGVWAGKKAVVIKVDTSGEVLNCDVATKVPQRTKTGGQKGSIFDLTDPTWLSNTNKIVQPLVPAATP